METYSKKVVNFLEKLLQSSESRVLLSLFLSPLYVLVIPEPVKFTTKNTTVAMLAMATMLASLGKDYIESTKYVIFTIIITSVILAKMPINKTTEVEDVEADIRVPSEVYGDLSDALRGNVHGPDKKRNGRYRV